MGGENLDSRLKRSGMKTQCRSFVEMAVWRGEFFSALGGLQELRELLSPDAFLGIGAPFDTGCADWPGVQVAALLAGGFRLVAPDLDLFAALLAPDVFRLWRPYLNASWTTFFKHRPILHPLQKKSYDINHSGLSGCNQ
jgi:hypothetical protein